MTFIFFLQTQPCPENFWPSQSKSHTENSSPKIISSEDHRQATKSFKRRVPWRSEVGNNGVDERMTGTSVLSQTNLLFPAKEPRETLELSSVSKERECVSLLKKCTSVKELKQIHAQILKLDLFSDFLCTGNLVATCTLSDWGSMDYACSIFAQIDDPDTFLFNAVIRGQVRHGNWDQALVLYSEMLESGAEPDNFTYPPLLKACAKLSAREEGRYAHAQAIKLGFQEDVFVQNSLVSMYGKCGDLVLACDVFRQMSEKTVASWSSIIGAHARFGKWRDCLELFGEMNRESCCRAEESTLVSVISACTHLGALDLGMSTHASLLRNISSLNVIVETSLIDMYVKCGCLEKGLSLFRKMGKRNRLSYTVIISGLAMHGRGEKALEIFSDMLTEGLEPDETVYVAVLSACSHSGLVNHGQRCFERMKHEHKIEPTAQHFGCMVDLLGRAGKLREALELIETMPFKPNEVIWRSLLSSCRAQNDIEIAEIAAQNLFHSNSRNPGDYVMLSNMYAKARKWDESAKLRTEIPSNGLVQTPGFSALEVKRKVYKFVSDDMAFPQSDEVREMIHQMEWQLRFDGYVADTTNVLLDVEDEEKIEKLKYHSQKLAIAFALINTSRESPVRIVRNLRMCSDCHTYTKFISVIYEREITVKDRNRFHHFKDGTCSCKDYW